MVKKPTYDELVRRIKKLEDAVAQSNREKESLISNSRYLQAILDNTNLPILFEKLSQVKNDDIRGKNDFDVFPKPVAELFQSQDREVIKHCSMAQFAETIQLPDGIHTFITSKFPLFDTDGNIYAVGGVCTDISELKIAQEALKESEEKYRNLFQYSGDGIILHDLEAHVIDANHKVVEQTGYTREEILGISALDLHPAETASKAKLALHEVSRSGFVHFETYLKKKDGQLFPAEMSASLLNIGDQKVIQCIVRDISDRKKLEEELLKVQKLESLGILAGGIAHDFNNLLTAIMGNISLARMHVKDDGIIHERLANAESATIRAQGLTQQLLTFSKGGAPVKKSLTLERVIKDSASFILSGSNVSCDLTVRESLWPVMADEGQISQVIQNIVKNADEAMLEGGTVSIQAENITVGTKVLLPLKEGRYIQVTIRDQGVGIPEEHISKVFDPYFSTKREGSGLGLATAYSIIKNHDGLITATSKVGKGSTFLIYLPVSDHSPRKEEISGKISVGKGEKILLMDDEFSILQVADDILQSLGYKVEFAQDGSEAIKLYQKAMQEGRPFDAVILDLTVPGGMGGIEAVRQLLKIDPNVKTIVSSGYANDPVMARYTDHGFKDVITKPYGVNKLSDVLVRLLG